MKKQKTILFRRKREKKTDYRKRLRLLLSNKPRVVIRRSLKNMLVQITKYSEKGDKILVSVSSKELKKNLDWKISKGNIPSAYLTGLIAGKKAIEKGIKEGILDIGLSRSTKGSRIYAALKGVIDAGVNIPHSKEVLPSEKALRGDIIAGYALELKKNNPEKYNKMFANYIKNKKIPEDIPHEIETAKRRIGVKNGK